MLPLAFVCRQPLRDPGLSRPMTHNLDVGRHAPTSGRAPVYPAVGATPRQECFPAVIRNLRASLMSREKAHRPGAQLRR